MVVGISGKIGSGKDEIGKILQYLSSTGMYSFKLGLSYKGYLEVYDKREHNYQIKKYADKLKDMVCLLIGCTREQLEDREFKEKELGEEWVAYKVFTQRYHYNEYKLFNNRELAEKFAFQFYGSDINGRVVTIKLTPRLLLQLLGTECGRQIIHPNIWVNALFADFEDNKSDWLSAINSNWIITDVRFPNEAKAIKDKGGIVIRVNRLKVGDVVYWDDPEGFSSGVYKIRSINNEEAWIMQQDSMAEAQVLPSELSLFKDPQHTSETALDDYDKFDYVIENDGTVQDLIDKVMALNIV